MAKIRMSELLDPGRLGGLPACAYGVGAGSLGVLFCRGGRTYLRPLSPLFSVSARSFHVRFVPAFTPRLYRSTWPLEGLGLAVFGGCFQDIANQLQPCPQHARSDEPFPLKCATAVFPVAVGLPQPHVLLGLLPISCPSGCCPSCRPSRPASRGALLRRAP